ncbi:MAG: prephenate dehydrogenase/arogenate dehydrogenase family protein [Methanosarcinales archaeon]|nr:prephenate dehydrogenase/arogenate dehydrogenase family protein [Methanosarcinales archaeon]
MTTMLIVGGTGDTGSWFARYFRDRGFVVLVWGPSGKVQVAESMGVAWASDLDRAVEESDVVVISVPIERTVEVIRDLAPRMKPGSLLMDVTSLKSEPLRAMDAFAPAGVEVLGTHPMFGPTMPRLEGQTIILTPAKGRGQAWLVRLREIFEADGASIEVLSAEEHDEIMAVVQALTHFAYIGIGSALRALDFDVARSRRFMSPVYEIMLDFVGRILDQSPELYASIQQNPRATRVRQVFIGECMRLAERAESGDLAGFQDIMRLAAQHYGQTHQALLRSDRIINARVRERDGNPGDGNPGDRSTGDGNPGS